MRVKCSSAGDFANLGEDGIILLIEVEGQKDKAKSFNHRPRVIVEKREYGATAAARE
jgi:hypothetical protein